jgi:hypothetical protein
MARTELHMTLSYGKKTGPNFRRGSFCPARVIFHKYRKPSHMNLFHILSIRDPFAVEIK